VEELQKALVLVQARVSTAWTLRPTLAEIIGVKDVWVVTGTFDLVVFIECCPKKVGGVIRQIQSKADQGVVATLTLMEAADEDQK